MQPGRLGDAPEEGDPPGGHTGVMKAQVLAPYFREMESKQHVGVLQVGDEVQVLQIVPGTPLTPHPPVPRRGRCNTVTHAVRCCAQTARAS